MHRTLYHVKPIIRKPNFVHSVMCPSSHTHHNSCVFRHSYCAIFRVYCFQLILNTSKIISCNSIYAAFHSTRTYKNSCSSRVLLLFTLFKSLVSRFQWPSGFRRGCRGARLLGLRVRIPRELGWLSLVSVVCCDGPIPRPDESYRL